jgi:hypothetical protein
MLVSIVFNDRSGQAVFLLQQVKNSWINPVEMTPGVVAVIGITDGFFLKTDFILWR